MNKTIVWTIVVIIILIIVGIFVVGGSKKTETPTSTIPPISVGTTTETTTGTTTSSTSTSTVSTATTTSSVSTSTKAVKEFTITAQNFTFAPKTMAVKKGDTVKITVKDTNGFHDFKIDEFKVATRQLSTGQKETVTFVADKIGTFEYYCSVGSHRTMGMKGTLTVTQ